MSGRVFELPDLGEGLHEAEIVAWHVGVGDHVVTDQPLLSVETDKAVVEVPSPQSGRVAALYGEPGDLIEVGAPLVEFAAAGAEDAGAIVGDMGAPGTGTSQSARARIKAAPAVRKLAEKLGVAVETLAGTGPSGAITQADVRVAASAAGSGAESVHGVRRAMLKNMARAGREVVAATLTDEADIQSWPPGSDVTIRLAVAIAAACAASPSLNAWFDSQTETRRLHKRVDLGLAVETDEGLFVPVLRDVGSRDAAALREGLERLKRDVAARSIPREELVGPTITLSNFGMFGGRFADLVVVPPQVAILGAGRIEERAMAVNGQAAVRRILPLSLTFDHRVVTGIEATRFLMAVIEELERPTMERRSDD